MPYFLLIAPVFATLAGGLLALRFRKSMAFLVSLGAGLLLGASFLDLLPEAISLGSTAGVDATRILGITLISFLIFLGIETVLDAVAQRWEGNAARRAMGKIGAGMMIFHSFRDGMAIGLSFAASHPAGYAVAVGIAAHDLGDGMNTIVLTTAGEEPTRTDFAFLLADSLAPLAGGLLTAWWAFSTQNSIVLLAIAAGFFLQMATSDFLPAVRRDTQARWYVLPAVLLGTATIYLGNLFLTRFYQAPAR